MILSCSPFPPPSLGEDVVNAVTSETLDSGTVVGIYILDNAKFAGVYMW